MEQVEQDPEFITLSRQFKATATELISVLEQVIFVILAYFYHFFENFLVNRITDTKRPYFFLFFGVIRIFSYKFSQVYHIASIMKYKFKTAQILCMYMFYIHSKVCVSSFWSCEAEHRLFLTDGVSNGFDCAWLLRCLGNAICSRFLDLVEEHQLSFFMLWILSGYCWLVCIYMLLIVYSADKTFLSPYYLKRLVFSKFILTLISFCACRNKKLEEEQKFFWRQFQFTSWQISLSPALR